MNKIELSMDSSGNLPQKKTLSKFFIVGLAIIGVILLMIAGSPFSLMLETNYLWNIPSSRFEAFVDFLKWLGLFGVYVICIIFLYKRKVITKYNLKSIGNILVACAVTFFLFVLIFGKPYARSFECKSILIPDGASITGHPKQVQINIWEKYYWNRDYDSACKNKPDISLLYHRYG